MLFKNNRVTVTVTVEKELLSDNPSVKCYLVKSTAPKMHDKLMRIKFHVKKDKVACKIETGIKVSLDGYFNTDRRGIYIEVESVDDFKKDLNVLHYSLTIKEAIQERNSSYLVIKHKPLTSSFDESRLRIICSPDLFTRTLKELPLDSIINVRCFLASDSPRFRGVLQPTVSVLINSVSILQERSETAIQQ